jgi:ABC-type uncharacterized transport system substrate-binding protein
VELLKEIVPRAVRVAVLWNSSIQETVAEWGDTQEPARSAGLTLRSFEARSPEELDGALAAIGHDLPDASVLSGSAAAAGLVVARGHARQCLHG